MSRFTLMVLVCFSLVRCGEQHSQQRTYVLSTGTTGGTFYPVGVALSTLVSAAEDADFSLTAISSAGSMENIKLLCKIYRKSNVIDFQFFYPEFHSF